MTLPDDNPKSVFGIRKPSIHAIPSTSLFYLGRAMQDGEIKYGLLNWRKTKVSATVYLDALHRHTWAWWEGEWLDRKSGIPHLAHAMANCAILLDASVCGVLKDDRPAIQAPLGDILDRLEQELKK